MGFFEYICMPLYSSASEDPAAGSRRVQFSVSDGQHDSAVSANAKVTIVAVNDPPVLSGGSPGWDAAPLLYSEDDEPAFVLPTAQLLDPDNEHLTSATVTISAGLRSVELENW